MLRGGAPAWMLMFLLAAATSAAQEHPEQAPARNPDPGTQAASQQLEEQPLPAVKVLPVSILKDQEYLWLRPFHMKRGDTAWIVSLVGATAGLTAMDRPVGQQLASHPPGAGYAFSRRVGQFSGAAADLGVASSFYLLGKWRRDERAQATGLLGFRALANSLIVVHSWKTVTQRPRPADGNGYPAHHADGEFFSGGPSFPSGHAAEAWALATIVAHQYGHHRWVPVTAYGLAGVVAVSRVTARKHFPSDVVVGSALGFMIGRYVIRDSSERRWKLAPAPTPGAGGAVALALQF